MKKVPKHLKPLLQHKAEEINWETDKIVSYSQFSTWKQCPHKWKLQNVDKLKNPPSIHLIFGTAIHTALQHYLKIMYEKSGAAADREDIVQLFEDTLRDEYKLGLEKNKQVHFSNPEEMNEFFEDGKTILEYFKKKKGGYFSTRKTHLIGIEFPLSYAPHEGYPNVKFKGFIDLIFYNENTETLCIYDIKTSTRGWKDKDKKDVICPPNKELNPNTNRCVNKCKPGYTRNEKFQCKKNKTGSIKPESIKTDSIRTDSYGSVLNDSWKI